MSIRAGCQHGIAVSILCLMVADTGISTPRMPAVYPMQTHTIRHLPARITEIRVEQIHRI